MTASCEGTLADRARVVYFLEDIAQEGLVRALVTRVAKEESVGPGSLQHDVRVGGGSRVLNDFRNFVKDLRRELARLPDILVVAIDGNCRRQAKLKQLENCFKPTDPIKERVVYAVPEPHIERWYLLDQRAFKDAVGGAPPPLSPFKCKKGYYKGLLREALRDAGVRSLLGGAEYGERIAENVDLNALAQQNAGFDAFLHDLRRVLRDLKSEV